MSAFVTHYAGERRLDWRTPRALFDALHAEYGFTLDGAASPENALLPRFSSAAVPVPWAGERVFCNPPRSSIPPVNEQAPSPDLAVFLVPARVNARWFLRALDLGAKLRFLPRRVKYERDGGGGGSPFDSILVIFGGDGR